MKQLVVLDGHTLNPGDLSWEPLRALASTQVHERTPASQVVARASAAELLMTNKTPLTASTLAQLPKLKYIGVLATGVNVVDVAAARERGIVVTNVPAYGPASVAQMAMAHLLHHSSRVAWHHQRVARGDWSASDDFCFYDGPLQSLQGQILGLVGYGEIARRLAAMAEGFGMRVVLTTPSRKTDLPEGRRWMPLEALLQCADVVSLHCPLTDDNQGMIDARRLALMKPTAMLLNTARGPLVNEADLARALHQGTIAAAGLDVLSSEPPRPDNPLLSAPNCSITPHNAWATLQARQNLLNIAVANLAAFLQGKPQNRV
ncbi:D-2-hydroxyacid dehydrogenase [Ferrimonas sp. SCSIO 43195]|uniref:D-2-hydroxyacid dehydrogenase n=1 Tax=Ferrimonas sp. SCSIO 43195 TaxID=2822844 RepID=UPI0020757870|nr:D-2-hydroxyacid dehydrogenase [Ferrimonas sp. SCSIO 43195]USD37956.1 D-2-hydroxyacid dehydrogenase [Ferrimonas sp. SCSIO 43195]